MSFVHSKWNLLGSIGPRCYISRLTNPVINQNKDVLCQPGLPTDSNSTLGEITLYIHSENKANDSASQLSHLDP